MQVSCFVTLLLISKGVQILIPVLFFSLDGALRDFDSTSSSSSFAFVFCLLFPCVFLSEWLLVKSSSEDTSSISLLRVKDVEPSSLLLSELASAMSSSLASSASDFSEVSLFLEKYLVNGISSGSASSSSFSLSSASTAILSCSGSCFTFLSAAGLCSFLIFRSSFVLEFLWYLRSSSITSLR